MELAMPGLVPAMTKNESYSKSLGSVLKLLAVEGME
jgi:hypothetical protein